MSKISESTHEFMLDVGEALNGGVINSEQMAEKFALLILQNLSGPDGVQRELPLRITDEGDRWKILGSYNIGLTLPFDGPWHLEVSKRDARVITMYTHASDLPVADDSEDRS